MKKIKQRVILAAALLSLSAYLPAISAPVADVPSIETKKVSAVLYSADTIMLMIVGTDDDSGKTPYGKRKRRFAKPAGSP